MTKTASFDGDLAGDYNVPPENNHFVKLLSEEAKPFLFGNSIFLSYQVKQNTEQKEDRSLSPVNSLAYKL